MNTAIKSSSSSSRIEVHKARGGDEGEGRRTNVRQAATVTEGGPPRQPHTASAVIAMGTKPIPSENEDSLGLV